MLTILLTLCLLQSVDIPAAIAEGAKAKPADVGVRVTGAAGGFYLMLRGPHDRIRAESAVKAAAFQPLAPGDISPKMAADTVAISASPYPPEFGPYGSHVTPFATAIRVRVKATGQIVEPLETDTFPMAWSNAMGGSFAGQGIVGWFDLPSLPSGELEILVATADTTGRKYTLKAKDRAKLR